MARPCPDYSYAVSPRLLSRARLVLVCGCAALALCATALAAKPPIAGRDVLTGKRLALTQYPGKPVFVNVWGSWCLGCTTEAPTLARFARAHKRQVAFLGINTEDSISGARAFYKRYNTEYPSIWDPRKVKVRRVVTRRADDARLRLTGTSSCSGSKAARPSRSSNAALRRVTR